MAHDLRWLTARPIAHRGLHDNNRAVMENSLEAARRAIERGCAIECDVQLSSDRVPMIFHDDTLDRMTGATGPLADCKAADLSRLRLGGSADRIPTVEAFLSFVAGRAPVVMELKGRSAQTDRGYFERLGPVLDGYEGDLALMSFDDWLVDQALALNKRPVGLTAEGQAPDVLAEHRAVFDRGCAFVSYNVHHLPNPFLSYVRDERGAPAITWTVRTPEEIEITRLHADQITFEGFLPQT